MSLVESPNLQPESKHALILKIPSINEPSPPSPASLASEPPDTRPTSDDSGVPTPTTTTETTNSEPTNLALTVNAIASSSSLPALSVKFAPLPELSPRKRRSTIPLGMAARGQLMRHRPGSRDRGAPPIWKDEGSGERRRRQEELAARHARFSAYAAYAAAREEGKDDEDDEDQNDWPRQGRHDADDPLLVIGRMVKVAGKTLWKRVSHKDVAAAVAVATSTTEGSEGQEDTGNRHSRARSSSLTLPPPPLRPILGNIISNVVDHHIEPHEEEEEEEGRVWEEEVGGSFPRNVSQTETIVEGRAVYSRLTSKVDVLSMSPPPSPTLLTSKRISNFMRPTSTKKLSASKAIKLAEGR